MLGNQDVSPFYLQAYEHKSSLQCAKCVSEDTGLSPIKSHSIYININCKLKYIVPGSNSELSKILKQTWK
jgi:hypothetical protein